MVFFWCDNFCRRRIPIDLIDLCCIKFSTAHCTRCTLTSLTTFHTFVFISFICFCIYVCMYVCHAVMHTRCYYDRLFQHIKCTGTHANLVWYGMAWHGICVSCNNPFVFRYDFFCPFIYVPTLLTLSSALISAAIFSTLLFCRIEHGKKNATN